jgi:hypothetical protein
MTALALVLVGFWAVALAGLVVLLCKYGREDDDE